MPRPPILTMRSTVAGQRDDAALSATVATDGTQALVALLRGIYLRVGRLDDAASDAASTATVVSILRQVAEAVNNGTGTAIPLNQSVVDLLGAYTGPMGGAAADDNVKAHLDLVKVDAVALLADVGDGSALALGSLVAAVGNPATDSLSSVLGQLATAASSGDPVASAVIAYLKQIVNDIEGSAGISVWPSALAPGNGVSLAEALRKVYDDVQAVLATVGASTPTTAGTADAGSTASILRDAARTEAEDTFIGQLLVMTSGANVGLNRPIVDFVAATDDLVVSPAYPNVISVGETYSIVPRSAFAEILLGNNDVNNVADTSLVVANRDGSVVERVEEIADDTDAVLADVGNASASSKGSLYGIVGNPTTDTLAAVLGQLADAAGEGAGATIIAQLRAILADTTGLAGAAMRGTDNAALASVATETRLAELDAAGLPTDVAAVKADTAALLVDTGDGTDAPVAAGDAGTLHAHIRDAQNSLKAAVVDLVDNVLVADVLGNKSDASSVAATASAMARLKNLAAVLAGTALASVATEVRLAELDAANLPADVAAVKADSGSTLTRVTATVVSGPYTTIAGGAEQTVYESTATTLRSVAIELSPSGVTLGGILKVLRKVNAAPYGVYATIPVPVGPSFIPFYLEFRTKEAFKVTFTATADEADVSINYNVISQPLA